MNFVKLYKCRSKQTALMESPTVWRMGDFGSSSRSRFRSMVHMLDILKSSQKDSTCKETFKIAAKLVDATRSASAFLSTARDSLIMICKQSRRAEGLAKRVLAEAKDEGS